ncbi:Uncharacterized membrane protein [Asanoa hainanensis]|uniref:Uncharacterized membrane protein n=1 Tax=Asanoa hainanensis TaxID=560556 RepID=A0A239P896_9ACTN|nr:TMEM175 family protein [Asanoa hainanensis]SNT63266.1 Uncharacterized membrane protein [Asanoa hainanensis]
MPKNRLEAFSDGVLAILITIMVLELTVPDGHSVSALLHTTGIPLLTYLLSFVYLGIYWNNHHHMFHLVRKVGGGVLWANLALLFWLSLLPFTTAWLNESHFARTPVVVYGLNLLVASVTYVVLQNVIIRQQGPHSPLRAAVGTDLKGKASGALFVTGTLCALLLDGAGVAVALTCFASVAVLWIVPDRRISRAVQEHRTAEEEPVSF